MERDKKWIAFAIYRINNRCLCLCFFKSNKNLNSPNSKKKKYIYKFISCRNKIEDEPYFLVDCSTDSKIKADFLELFSMEFLNFRTFNDGNKKYKFIMKIQDENLLKSLAFCINLVFKNRENLKNTRYKIRLLYLDCI